MPRRSSAAGCRCHPPGSRRYRAAASGCKTRAIVHRATATAPLNGRDPPMTVDRRASDGSPSPDRTRRSEWSGCSPTRCRPPNGRQPTCSSSPPTRTAHSALRADRASCRCARRLVHATGSSSRRDRSRSRGTVHPATRSDSSRPAHPTSRERRLAPAAGIVEMSRCDSCSPNVFQYAIRRPCGDQLGWTASPSKIRRFSPRGDHDGPQLAEEPSPLDRGVVGCVHDPAFHQETTPGCSPSRSVAERTRRCGP